MLNLISSLKYFSDDPYVKDHPKYHYFVNFFTFIDIFFNPNEESFRNGCLHDNPLIILYYFNKERHIFEKNMQFFINTCISRGYVYTLKWFKFISCGMGISIIYDEEVIDIAVRSGFFDMIQFLHYNCYYLYKKEHITWSLKMRHFEQMIWIHELATVNNWNVPSSKEIDNVLLDMEACQVKNYDDYSNYWENYIFCLSI